ncbi:MAG: efflux RND transporter periplasmic adaptor subunit [Marinicellaceae bacterium]
MKKIVKLFIPVAVLVGSIFLVQAMVAAKPTPEKKPKAQRVVSLYVDEAVSQTLNITVNSQGEVKPKTAIDLTPLVSGQIISISDKFAEGAEFSKNETLIKIDDTDYKLAVVQAQALVASAKVNVERELANSKIKLEQWKRKNSNANPTDFALNKPQIAEAKAKLKAAESELHNAQIKLARTNIKAPFQGRVMLENIGLGQHITPATNLGHIFSTDTVEIRLPLTDTQLEELNLPMGFMAGKNNAPIVNFSALIGDKNHNWQGKIVRTNASIDQESRLIYAIAEVKDPYGAGADNNTALAVGMYVSASIQSNKTQDTLVLPRLALRSNNKVYVVNDESKLEIRIVSVLSTNEKYVHISSGIKAGEKVVTSTVPIVSEGMDVKALTKQEAANIQETINNQG